MDRDARGARRPVVIAASRVWIRLVLTNHGLEPAAVAMELLQGGYPKASDAAGDVTADGRSSGCGESAGKGWYDDARRSAFARRASEVGAIAAQIREAEGESHGESVMRMVLLRLVEIVLYNFVGLEDASGFLERCLLDE